MKTKETKLLSIAFILMVLSVVLMTLALLTFPSLAQIDDGYPAPIDEGYPIDYGYPIYDPYPVTGYPIVEPYPVDIGYPIYAYPIIPSYPDPIGYPAIEAVSEPTFSEEFQAEVETVKQIIADTPPTTESRIYRTWTQLVFIVQHYGKMLFMAR